VEVLEALTYSSGGEEDRSLLRLGEESPAEEAHPPRHRRYVFSRYEMLF
jgi:hypothetical protein